VKRILSILFIGSSTLLIAQSTSEAKSWIGIKTKFQISEKLHNSIGLQYRSKSDFKELDKYFFENNIEYDFSKEFSLEVGLRIGKNNDTSGGQQGIENQYRVHTDLNYNKRFGNVKFKSRVRYQLSNEFGSTNPSSKYLRFKNGIEFHIDNWNYDPEFLIEPFLSVGDPNFSGVKKWRYGAQTDLSFGEHKLKVAYFYMTATQFIERHHIIGLFYKFKL
jgi:hypothetical protein